jgi:hypothetical protein
MGHRVGVLPNPNPNPNPNPKPYLQVARGTWTRYRKEEATYRIVQMAIEGYDVMLLPVLGSARTLFKCLDDVMMLPVLGGAGKLLSALIVQKKEKKFGIGQKREHIQQASPTQYTQSTESCVPTPIPGKTKAQPQQQGER